MRKLSPDRVLQISLDGARASVKARSDNLSLVRKQARQLSSHFVFKQLTSKELESIVFSLNRLFSHVERIVSSREICGHDNAGIAYGPLTSTQLRRLLIRMYEIRREWESHFKTEWPQHELT